jgi:GINS complex subunit 2
MEVAFLCEMEMVTVVPRQKLESLNLLGVSPPPNPSIILFEVQFKLIKHT